MLSLPDEMMAMPDPSKSKIMVVDDDAVIRESLTALLRSRAYEVSSATNGYDALWQLKSGSVGLMITDLETPGLAGLEFLSVIRERFAEIAVIAMSERPRGESELAAAVADAFYPEGRARSEKARGDDCSATSRSGWAEERKLGRPE